MPYYLASCYILLSQVVICCFDTQACCLFLHFLACWCFMSFSLASYLIMWSYIKVHLHVSDCIMLHLYIYIFISLSLSLSSVLAMSLQAVHRRHLRKLPKRLFGAELRKRLGLHGIMSQSCPSIRSQDTEASTVTSSSSEPELSP